MVEDAHRVPGGHLGPFSRLTYFALRSLTHGFALVWFRVTVKHPERLPGSGRLIVSPMHRSNLDVPILGASSPRRLRYLAKGSLFKNAFWHWLLTVVGGFPLDRTARADRGALKAAMSVLEREEALAVFPEGERKSGPWVYPMLDGAVWLSTKSGAPILPVGIGGSERAMPKGANLPRPTKLVFLYGEPIPAPANADGSRVSRSQMRDASNALRATLQALFDEAQELAGSPNPPPEERPPLPEDVDGQAG